MLKIFLLSAFAVIGAAQTGPLVFTNKTCKSNQVRILATLPGTATGGIEVSVPVCLALGAGMRLSVSDGEARLEVDPSFVAVPKAQIKRVDLSQAAIAAGDQLTVTLDKTPAPGSLLLVSFSASRIGSSAIEMVPFAGGASPRSVVITVPSYRPFTTDDVLTIAYWTLEP